MKFKSILSIIVLLTVIISCEKENNENDNQDNSSSYPSYTSTPCEQDVEKNYINLKNLTVNTSFGGFSDLYMSNIKENPFNDGKCTLYGNHTSSSWRFCVYFDHMFFHPGKYTADLDEFIGGSYSTETLGVTLVIEDWTFGRKNYYSKDGIAYLNKFAEDSIEISFCDIDFEGDNTTIIASGKIRGGIPEQWQGLEF